MSNLDTFSDRQRASSIPPNRSLRLVKVVPAVERRDGKPNGTAGHDRDAIKVTWLSELSNGDRDRWENMCKRYVNSSIPELC